MEKHVFRWFSKAGHSHPESKPVGRNQLFFPLTIYSMLILSIWNFQSKNVFYMSSIKFNAYLYIEEKHCPGRLIGSEELRHFFFFQIPILVYILKREFHFVQSSQGIGFVADTNWWGEAEIIQAKMIVTGVTSQSRLISIIMLAGEHAGLFLENILLRFSLSLIQWCPSIMEVVSSVTFWSLWTRWGICKFQKFGMWNIFLKLNSY